MESEHHHHHHHHHGSHKATHLDDSEKFKRRTLSASKRRKILAKVLFALLSVVAVALVLFVVWIYTHE